LEDSPIVKKIKAVLFDLDGTLRHHIPSGGDVFMEYARSLGLQISEEDSVRAQHWEHFYFASSLEIHKDSETFKADQKGFWVNFAKRLLVALGAHPTLAADLAPKVSVYMDEFHKPEVHVPGDAYTLLESLRSSNYILGVVSNREKPYLEELKKIKIDGYIKFSLAGGEVNSYKPDGVIFKRALELSGTAADETMYVGDNYFADIIGARRAGLRPVLYDPANIFPDEDCATIKSFDALRELLNDETLK